MSESMSMLNWALEHELRCSQRYRRFLTVVGAECQDTPTGLKGLLGEVLRESDEIIALDSTEVAIVMAETDRQGALIAIDRYHARFNGAFDIRFGVATFPVDAGDHETLLGRARSRLIKAKTGQPGTVIFEDSE
jgi:hypothetical protein